ncbi:MAG TPA: FHA domain-containing protein, partial [Streptosporangiaceae bacterium]|nr:FHA domain-containing protein [Streptosporangiaceae bacterium]
MTIGREVSSPALVVRTQGFDRSLEPGRSYSIGRNPESDIVVEEARVSWRHAVLRLDGSTWLLEDLGSTNGTFVGVQRVQRVEITADTVVRLGHPDDGQRLWCSVTPARQAPAAPPPTAAAGPFAPTYPPPAAPAPPPQNRQAAALFPPAVHRPAEASPPAVHRPAEASPPAVHRPAEASPPAVHRPAE